jgi:hypothetical protein
MSYSKSINTTTVIVESDDINDEDIHISHTASPNHTTTYIQRGDYANVQPTRTANSRGSI